MKKVIITGGAGFIGSNLVRRSLKEGHYVISIDNLSTGKRDNSILSGNYLFQDILHKDMLDFDVDLVYHLAALSRIQPSFNKPDTTFKTNVLGTEKVMEWARMRSCKVVYAGSSSKHHDPYQSPYAMYKFLGEVVCKLYKESYNLNVEIARFYNVYGPGENIDEIYGNVIGIWISKIMKGEPLPIVGDGEQKRSFSDVDAVSYTHLTLPTSDLV